MWQAKIATTTYFYIGGDPANGLDYTTTETGWAIVLPFLILKFLLGAWIIYLIIKKK